MPLKFAVESTSLGVVSYMDNLFLKKTIVSEFDSHWVLVSCQIKLLVINGLRAILKKSLKQHPTKQQLYGHLPPISETAQIRQTRHIGHCRINKDELISDVLQWTSSHRRARVGRPARTFRLRGHRVSSRRLSGSDGCRDEWWERESGKSR